MPDLAEPDAVDVDQPLAGVVVVEVGGELTGYAGRLLVDLGARVTRVVPTALRSKGDPEETYLHGGKSELPIDVSSEDGVMRLLSVIAECDVVLQQSGADAPELAALDPKRVRSANPSVVHVILSPFGITGPRAGWVSTDLVRLAAGGLLWLGGYPDTEPVAPYGEQSSYATSLFATVATLLALIERDLTGEGRTIDVSAQEVLVQALETSLAEFELTGSIRSRLGSTAREAGTGTYPCADGYVSLVAGRLGTAAAWLRLREWLVEECVPGADELLAPEWEDLAHRQRPESIARFAALFSVLTESRSKEDLYLEAQHRNIALAPVNTPQEVLADHQLMARGFFRLHSDGPGRRLLLASPPYRFSAPAHQHDVEPINAAIAT